MKRTPHDLFIILYQSAQASLSYVSKHASYTTNVRSMNDLFDENVMTFINQGDYTKDASIAERVIEYSKYVYSEGKRPFWFNPARLA